MTSIHDRVFSKVDARTRSAGSLAFEPYLRGLAGMRGMADDKIWGTLLQGEAGACGKRGLHRARDWLAKRVSGEWRTGGGFE